MTKLPLPPKRHFFSHFSSNWHTAPLPHARTQLTVLYYHYNTPSPSKTVPYFSYRLSLFIISIFPSSSFLSFPLWVFSLTAFTSSPIQELNKQLSNSRSRGVISAGCVENICFLSAFLGIVEGLGFCSLFSACNIISYDCIPFHTLSSHFISLNPF